MQIAIEANIDALFEISIQLESSKKHSLVILQNFGVRVYLNIIARCSKLAKIPVIENK